LVSVGSIQYVDTDGATQTLAATEYTVDATQRAPGRIVEAFDKSWPDTRVTPNAVTVTFDAGFGAAVDVPEEYKQIIKLYFEHLYDHRESTRDDKFEMIPFLLQALINQYRIKVFG